MKALKLSKHLQQEEGDSSTVELFLAYKGRFDKFRKHQKLHNIKFTGKADRVAASIFPNEFKAIVASEGYKQVFNADETN